MRGVAVAAGIALSLATGTAWADVIPTTALPDKAARPVPHSIWHIADNGDGRHLQSGLACDATVGDFQRESLQVYRSPGLDVSCGYVNRNHSVITMYLTKRNGQTVADDFENAKKGVLIVTRDAQPLPDAEQKSFDSDLAWQHFIYKEKEAALHSGVWIADLDGWTFEYRATYPVDDESTVFAEMSALTAKAEQSAGVQLGVCAKNPPPERSGTVLPDINQTALIVIELIGAGEAMLKDKDKAPPPPKKVIWCEEGAVTPSQVPVFLWRGVYEDGSDAHIDKASVLTNGEPPELLVAPEGVAQKVNEQHGPAGKSENWLISLTRETHTWIFALYDGRPPSAAVAALLADIYRQTAKALGGYDIANKTIKLDVPGGK